MPRVVHKGTMGFLKRLVGLAEAIHGTDLAVSYGWKAIVLSFLVFRDVRVLVLVITLVVVAFLVLLILGGSAKKPRPRVPRKRVKIIH